MHNAIDAQEMKPVAPKLAVTFWALAPEKEAWSAAAEADSRTLNMWVQLTLNAQIANPRPAETLQDYGSSEQLTMTIQVAAADKATWSAAAKSEDRTLTAWIRRSLNSWAPPKPAKKGRK